MNPFDSKINALRPDEPAAPLPHDRALKHAPRRDDDFFRVPKVLE